MIILPSGLVLLAIWCIITAVLNLVSVKISRATLGTILLNLLLLLAGILIFLGR